MPALALIYSYIDSLAWLSVHEEHASGAVFKEWALRYILSKEGNRLPDDCNEKDLWGARCAILHERAPDSRDSQRCQARLLEYHLDGIAIGRLCINDSDLSYQSQIVDSGIQSVLICLDMFKLVVHEAAVEFLSDSLADFCHLIASNKLDENARKRLDKFRRQYCLSPASHGSP